MINLNSLCALFYFGFVIELLPYFNNLFDYLIINDRLLIFRFEIIIFASFIFFSGKATKILDITKKLATTIAASTIAYTSHYTPIRVCSLAGKSINKDEKDTDQTDNRDKLIIKIITQMKINKQNKYNQSFSLAFILSCLDININDNASTLTNYSFSVFLLSLIAMLCFLNVLGFLIFYIFVQQGKYEEKYPKLKRIINYYKKTTIFYVILEALICFICLLMLIIFAILYV